MTKAPERIWAEFGYDMRRGAFWDEPSGQSIEYLHIDHALDLVAAEREACASIAEECFAPGSEEEVAGEVIAASIRSRTDDAAQAALDRLLQEARNEALREAAALVKYEGEEFAGMREGVMFDRLSKKILALITEDQSDE
jgi:hypothetical protein